MAESTKDNLKSETILPIYTAKDFTSDRDVRWCPGCGDYSVLAQVQRSFPQIINEKKEKFVFISGIGCSSRFPYYMDTYGFHTIHGRAAAIASGLKTANPDLSVWIATGDGDALSIGGNHFIHLLRRNIDVNILLFNNRIYGLTKGQVSPTSEHGKVTKSTPYGSIEYPVNPVSLALGMEGTFIARTIDRDPKHLQEMILRCYKHYGTTLLEILQNCVIFNDGAYALYTDKETKDDNVIYLEHNKPHVFGKQKDKGIKLDGWKPLVISINDGKNSINDCLVHDETSKDLAFILSSFNDNPGLPMPLGVFLARQRNRYEVEMENQITEAKKKFGEGNIDELLMGPSTWEIT
ncbi:MAG: 2-oxoacid:ferredoxin oxidoreductase subunit beta [Ignavibacteriae bacterium]|nr:2-oxoacid:ferredoxin oxidoreductase subunit beta [Ignavibacteriota bacterium]